MTKPRRQGPRRTADGQPPVEWAQAGREHGPDDAFFRHIVAGMRNAVLAIMRDGRLALINDEAYRIFGIAPRAEDIGQPIATVLKDHPDVVRVLMGVFDLHHVP